MIAKDVIFLLLLFSLTANGIRYEVDDTIAPIVEHRKAQVYAAADGCVASLGTSLGEDFLSCVLEELRSAEEKYKRREEPANDDDPFPVPYYDLRPLTFDNSDLENDPVVRHAHMLPDLLRNYTCARIQDGGSRPISTESWIYDEKSVLEQIDEQICTASADDKNNYILIEGYLAAGDDVDFQDGMDVEEAKAHCDSLPVCEAFTLNIIDDDGSPPTVYFKGRSSADKTGPSKEWRSYIRRQLPDRCLSDEADTPLPPVKYSSRPQEYKIEIIRREPLVAVVPNFATDQECEELMKAGGLDQDMAPAYEGNGNGQSAPSTYRPSYSSNIYVDFEDRTDMMTRFAERTFAFVRRMTGYEVYGPGHEPINAILYKNVGDENRPHCDGHCHGEPYELGARVATSIVYCDVPEIDGQPAGGQTAFTRSGLMVAPRKGDLLLFAYKNANNTFDNGFSEHSACKILGGRKWVAVQWYREGVDYEHPYKGH
jgi:hypothetical protein